MDTTGKDMSQKSREQIHNDAARIVGGRGDEFDIEQALPDSVIADIGNQGWLGAVIPEAFGGSALDNYSLGHVCESLAGESGSLLSLMTVHTMVSFAIARWGSARQRDQWLGNMATGKVIGAFALTEVDAGSDAKSASSTLVREGDELILDGSKKWISLGQKAGLFLVAAKLDNRLVSVLVPRNTPGFEVRPMGDLYGFRAAMLGELQFSGCRLPLENLVGNVDFGLSQIVGSVLDQGRYCIAWGAVGLAQCCLDASLTYAKTRRQFDQPLGGHQLIQEVITNMMVETKASRLMCMDAAALRTSGDSNMLLATVMAKYSAGNAAERIAGDAVQLHGANGFSINYPVQRCLRDAKVLNIIEGSTQMQQILIARHGLRKRA